MLFRKKIDPSCEYCSHGRIIDGGRELLCSVKGLVEEYSPCRRFDYDPLLRVPPKQAPAGSQAIDLESLSLE